MTEEEEAAKFLRNLTKNITGEPVLLTKEGAINEDWLAWYIVNHPGPHTKKTVMVMFGMRLMIYQAYSNAVIKAIWEDLPDEVMAVVAKNPQTWEILATLDYKFTFKKPGLFKRFFNLFKRKK